MSPNLGKSSLDSCASVNIAQLSTIPALITSKATTHRQESNHTTLPISVLKYFVYWNTLQIMICCHQIIYTIPWLSCEQLPYLSEQPRLLRVWQIDKSEMPLPSLTYKYIPLRHSSSTLPFQSPKTYSSRRRPWRAAAQPLARTL